MNDEERQEHLAKLARRTREEEAQGQRSHDMRVAGQAAFASTVGGMARSKTFGCLSLIVAIAILGSVAGALNQCMAGGDEAASSDGPIPARFAGAYNGYSCEGGHVDSLVTVRGDHINFGSASITVDEVISESGDSFTFRGSGFTLGGGRERERTVTMTYADVGQTAQIDGSEFTRCSQY